MRRRHLMPGPLAGLIAEIGEVDLLLVLAMDVSHSISPEEGRLQRAGYQAALLHDQALAAIRGGRNGAIGVACVAWAGMDFQKVTVPWTRITGRRNAEAWGAALIQDGAVAAEEAAAVAFPNGPTTCISRGIDFSRDVLRDAPWSSLRRVIDISGDGPNNDGPPPEAARDRAVAEGITVNGLAIEGDPDVALELGPGATLAEYYRNSVIGGPAAFVVVAEHIDAFGAAIRRKLILEIADFGGLADAG